MQVSIEKLSNIECRLTIVVPADQVKATYEKELNKIAKNKEIPGFRPGKAPIPMIEQRFGSTAYSDALSEVMRTATHAAILEEKLMPVSQPVYDVEPQTIISPEQSFQFKVTFEVMAEIGDVQFAMNSLEKPVVDVTSEDIERVMTQLLKQHTQWKKIDRSAKERDRVVIDYYAVFDGKPELNNKVQKFPLELGGKAMLPGFEEGLIGVVGGEERTLNLTFPTDFYNPVQAGKPVDFVVKVHEVYEAEVPMMDAAFIQKLGVKSGILDDLKTQIKQSLIMERDRYVKNRVKEQVFTQLLEQNPLEVPKSIIAREARQIHDEVYQHREHDHHQHSETELDGFSEIARKRVIVGLLMEKYARQKEVTVDHDRVKKRIEEIAAVYEQPQEVIAWLSAKERRGNIESQVMEDQVLDIMLEGVPVTEKPMTYAELVDARI